MTDKWTDDGRKIMLLSHSLTMNRGNAASSVVPPSGLR